MVTPTLASCAARDASFRTRLAALRQHAEDLVREEDRLRSEALEVRSAEAVLRVLLDRARADDEARIAEAATCALRDVFADQELAVVLAPRTWRDQPALEIRLRDEARGVEGDPLDAFGGGPAALLGVVLQAITLVRRPDLARLIVLDETLDRVSAGGYGHAAGRLLSRLAREFGIDFLVVTHAAELIEAADRHYQLDGRGFRRVEAAEDD